jgi:hypothetical protein
VPDPDAPQPPPGDDESSLRAEGEFSAPFRPYGLRLAVGGRALGGRLSGIAGEAHEVTLPGWGLTLRAEALGLFGFEFGYDRPAIEPAGKLGGGLSAEAKATVREVALRVGLLPEGRVQPWFGVGKAWLLVSTELSQQQLSGSESAGTLELEGEALRLGVGAEIGLMRVGSGPTALELRAAAGVRYFLTDWDRLYCTPGATSGATGSGGSCLYDRKEGVFQRSDLLLADLGLSLVW